MKIGYLACVFAVSGALFLAGCPGDQGTGTGGTGAGGAAAGASKDVATKYDPNNKEHLFFIYAAHQANDPELLKKACMKYGLYDSNGMPIMDQYSKYSESMSKYAQEHSEEWNKFLQENNGKWKEYVEKRM